MKLHYMIKYRSEFREVNQEQFHKIVRVVHAPHVEARLEEFIPYCLPYDRQIRRIYRHLGCKTALFGFIDEGKYYVHPAVVKVYRGFQTVGGQKLRNLST